MTEHRATVTEIEFYPRGWRLLLLTLGTKPRGPGQWLRFLWGFDIWVGPLPLLRTLVVLDAVLVWALR